MKKLSRLKWPILLIVVGIALNVAAVVSIYSSFRDSGTQFMGPGKTTVNIVKPGHYTLWHETKTIVDGKFLTFSNELPSGVSIKIAKRPEGTDVPLRPSGSTYMESGGKRRVSVAQLTFAIPGEYEVDVAGLDEKRVFYLDEAKFLRMFMRVMVCGLVGMLFILAGIVAGVYVMVRGAK